MIAMPLDLLNDAVCLTLFNITLIHIPYKTNAERKEKEGKLFIYKMDRETQETRQIKFLLSLFKRMSQLHVIYGEILLNFW